MAACYFMGARSGVAKKSGNWFGCFNLLHTDNFGQWQISAFWFPDKDTFDLACSELSGIGCPVVVGLDVSGKIQNIQLREDIPSLPLSN